MSDARLAAAILQRARAASSNWVDFSTESKDTLVLYERGRLGDRLRVTTGDVLRVLDRIRRGDPPVSPEYRQRAVQSLSWQTVPDDVVDVIIQLAVFGEVVYWGHADFIQRNMLRNDLTLDSPYAIMGI